jgi:hypothetical protein
MSLKLSLIVQFSRSVPVQSDDRALGKILRRIQDTLHRLRFNKPVRRPAMADQSSEITDTDSSWLGPPPGYDEVGGDCTCLSHSETDCSSEIDLRTSENETVIPGATIDGPGDMPAATC